MADLPTDIITEILVRLPVKSLARFSCVKKSWYSLIKNPNFINLHLKKTLISNSETYLILPLIHIAELNLDHVHIPLSFSEVHNPLSGCPKISRNFPEVNVIGSCNGILCLSSSIGNIVCLYNPLTKSHRKLRVKGIITSRDRRRLFFGFGYDSSTDDYKVFCFYQEFDKGYRRTVKSTEYRVFSCRSNSWKSIEVIFGSDFLFDDCLYSNGVYLNEALYFLECDIKLQYKFVAKFDCRTDTLLRIEFPTFDDNIDVYIDRVLELSALDGCLCMSVSDFLNDMEYGLWAHFDLWMMKDCRENEPWVRLFRISDVQGIGIGVVVWEISAVVRSKDGSRVLLSINGSKLGWYDLGNGSFETITACGQPKSWDDSQLLCFSGSLVSLVDDKLQFERKNMTQKKKKKSVSNCNIVV